MKKLISAIVFMSLVGFSFQAMAGYSAIAYNKSARVWGEAHGFRSADAAVYSALASCGAGCISLAWAFNSCVALANNANGDYGFSWNYYDANSATSAALDACNAKNTGACTWRVWACN